MKPKLTRAVRSISREPRKTVAEVAAISVGTGGVVMTHIGLFRAALVDIYRELIVILLPQNFCKKYMDNNDHCISLNSTNYSY